MSTPYFADQNGGSVVQLVNANAPLPLPAPQRDIRNQFFPVRKGGDGTITYRCAFGGTSIVGASLRMRVGYQTPSQRAGIETLIDANQPCQFSPDGSILYLIAFPPGGYRPQYWRLAEDRFEAEFEIKVLKQL